MKITRYPDLICVRFTRRTWFQVSTGRFMFEIAGCGLWFGIDFEVLFSERQGITHVTRIGRLAIMRMRTNYRAR